MDNMASQLTSSIGSLQISEDKKAYITNKISPVLEQLVTSLITEQPDNLHAFCHKWFAERCGASVGDDVDSLKQKNENMRKSLVQLAGDFVESGSGAPPVDEDDDEEEEEEEDEDFDDAAFEAQMEARAAADVKAGARTSVSAEAYGAWNQKKTDFVAPMYEKSDDVTKRLTDLLKTVWFFNCLGEKEMNIVIGALQEVKIEKGTTVINKGDDGDFMFVIEAGQLECWKNGDDGNKLSLKTCEPGDIFGELALLYNTTRAANVTANEECITWKLERDTFANVVLTANQKTRDANKLAISELPLLTSLDEYQKSQLCDALRVIEYKAGDIILNQGDQGNDCYFVKEGQLEALKDGVVVKTYSRDSVDRHFGELALLNNTLRAATVRAVTDCSVMALDRKAFARLLGNLMDVLRATSY